MGLDFSHTGARRASAWRTLGIVRRLRTLITDAENRRLHAQLAAALDRACRLDERLAELQKANEGAYKELAAATGGPSFDSKQPFGQVPARGGAQ
ncbi:hypothetical protein [Streptomyces sp. Amel2xC10]|uniref:hypothetical protein n=1 Tax=Streptomyces sp. Amel2xC10 TaxID=1305826 RepID=UPI000A08C197|nr:hypothetical protein [Streptomyces sp. Amel2xC10]SMF85987.1 hypothetical protein SAMN02745830_07099 [Streptomyces sp. Amel2xC10]